MSEQDRRPEDGVLKLLSHDLKSPLGPLTLAVSSLAEGYHAPEEAQSLARIAVAQTDRLRRLIDATLIASGREPSSSPARIPLDGVLREVSYLFTAAGGDATVGMLPHVFVQADRVLLRDALAGLFEVAAGESGAIMVRLEVTPERAVLTIGGADIAGFIEALCAEGASGSPSAFVLAADRIVSSHGGGIEVIDEGIVVWLPVAAADPESGRPDGSFVAGAA